MQSSEFILLKKLTSEVIEFSVNFLFNRKSNLNMDYTVIRIKNIKSLIYNHEKSKKALCIFQDQA